MKLETQIRLAANLRRLRAFGDFSQSQLARFLGVNRSVYALYESGQRCPDAELLYEASKIYGIRMESLLTADPEFVTGEAACSRMCEDGEMQLLTLFHALSPLSKGRLLERAEILAAWDGSLADSQRARRNSMHP